MIAIIKYFLYLGATGFGGPLALIQQMRQHYVEKEKTISGVEFDQAFTLIKAMPGPIAFQMAVYCSQHLKGRLAGIAAGIALLIPSFFLMLLAGVGHHLLTENLIINKILIGFQYAVAAVILYSLKSFFKSYNRRPAFWLIFVIAGVFYGAGLLPEPAIIIGFGITCVLLNNFSSTNRNYFPSLAFLAIDWELIWKIFKVCSYAGAIVFGTGLAMLPVLQNQFVVQHHWLSLQTFNYGVTFGQMTPGPVTITATFLGYKVAGVTGALAATIGIFIMPLIHMITWFPKALKWLSRQTWIEDFILGATAAVVGVLVITVFQMYKNSMSLFNFWFIFCMSFVLLVVQPKLPIIQVIFIGGLTNLLIGFSTM